MLFQRFSRIVFSLALAIYLGGLIALGAVAAPALAHTVRQDHIIYPALPPGLDMDRQTIGQLFGPILYRFQYVELACSACMVLALALETWLLRHRPPAPVQITPLAQQTPPTDLSRPAPRFPFTLKLRSLLMLLLLALVAHDYFMLTPEVWDTRDLWRAAVTTNPAAATGPLADKFNSLHNLSEIFGQVKSCVLIALLVLTAWQQSPDRP